MLEVYAIRKPYFDNQGEVLYQGQDRDEARKVALAFVVANPWSYAEARYNHGGGIFGEQVIEFESDQAGRVSKRLGGSFWWTAVS